VVGHDAVLPVLDLALPLGVVRLVVLMLDGEGGLVLHRAHLPPDELLGEERLSVDGIQRLLDALVTKNMSLLPHQKILDYFRSPFSF